MLAGQGFVPIAAPLCIGLGIILDVLFLIAVASEIF